MGGEELVTIPAPPFDLKRKLDEVEPEQKHSDSDNGDVLDANKPATDSSSHAKRPKLEEDVANGLDNGKTIKNGSLVEAKEEEQLQEPKKEEIEKLSSTQNDENPDSVPLDNEVQDDPIHADESESKSCGVDQPADDPVKPEDNQPSFAEAIVCKENIVEECKDINGGEPQQELNDGSSQIEIGKEENKEVDGENSQKMVDDSESTTRRIDVPSSKVGVLIGKGGDTIRHLQFNSGARIQILRDSEADPNSSLRPVEIIGNVTCIEAAEKLINEVIAEAEAGGSPALVAMGHPATNALYSGDVKSANGMMVIFYDLLDQVKKLQPDVSLSKLCSLLSSFADLEKHGFDVTTAQSRINKLMSLQDGLGKKSEERKALEKIEAEEIERLKLDKEMVELECRILELKRQQEAAEEKKEAVKEKKEAVEKRALEMKSCAKKIYHEIEDLEVEFQKTVSAPW